MTRVLIVSDDHRLRYHLTTALRSDVVATRTAADGNVSLDADLIWNPDVVVLDLDHPYPRGWSFAVAHAAANTRATQPRDRSRARRIAGHTTQARVVLLAGNPPAAQATADAMGAFAVLGKPVDLAVLVDTVTRAAIPPARATSWPPPYLSPTLPARRPA